MIITCPHCQTKYQVTFEAIGSAGRKVQCAHCQEAWDQRPLPKLAVVEPDDDILFDAMAEDALDEVMLAEEKAASTERAASGAQPADPSRSTTPPTDAAEHKKLQAAFSRRQSAMSSRQPLARLRRAARATGLLFLVGLLAGGYFGRVPIVERYPDLAGVYEAVGLGVNVVGLDFSNLESMKTLSGGKDVLMVSAQIVGLSPDPVAVPPVVVSLLDSGGNAVYEWSVVPRARDLMAGERATFDTSLSLPPGEASRVRLSFAGGSSSQSGPASPAQPLSPAEAPTPAAAAPTHH